MASNQQRRRRDPNAAAAAAVPAPPVGSNPAAGGFLGYLKTWGPLLAAVAVPVAIGAGADAWRNRAGGSYNGSMDYDW